MFDGQHGDNAAAHVIEKLPPAPPEPMQYQITDGKLERWVYSPLRVMRRASRSRDHTAVRIFCPS